MTALRQGWPALLVSAAARFALGVLALLLLASVAPAVLGWQTTVVMSGSMSPTLRPGANVAIIDARKQTEAHGTPPDLLRCELAAVGYRQIGFYDLQEDTYLAVFTPPEPESGPASPAAIRPCVQGRD